MTPVTASTAVKEETLPALQIVMVKLKKSKKNVTSSFSYK